MALVPTAYWAYQVITGRDADTVITRTEQRLVQLELVNKKLLDLLEARERTQPGGTGPGAAALDEAIGRDLKSGAKDLLDQGAEGEAAIERLLKDGKTDQAEALLRRLAEKDAAEGAQANKRAAQRFRLIGAYAFLNNTQKALDAYARAAELDPEDWEGWWRLGQLQLRYGDLKAARASFEKLLALRNRIDDPRIEYYARTALGETDEAAGNREPALDQYEQATVLIKALANRDPNNAQWQRDLSVSYDRIGDIRAARGDRDGALKAYEDGLTIAKALANRDPNNAEWQRDLSVSYDRVGDIRAARGDRDGALKAYEDGLTIRKALANRDPNNAEWQRDLSVSYTKIGDIRAARGDRDGALKAYEDSLAIRKALANRDPNNAEGQTDLVVSAYKIASLGGPDACRHAREGLAIAKRLDAEGRLDKRQPYVEVMEALVAARCG